MCKMVDISAKAWNKARVSVMRVHENDRVNKILLKLLCISEIAKRYKNGKSGKNIYDLIHKEFKGKCNGKDMKELTKPQIRKYKIDRAIMFKGSKHSMYVHENNNADQIVRFKNNRADLGFNQVNLILEKEQSVVILLLKAFYV